MDSAHNSAMMKYMCEGVMIITDKFLYPHLYGYKDKNKNNNHDLSLPRKPTTYGSLYNMYRHNCNANQNLKIRAAIYCFNIC